MTGGTAASTRSRHIQWLERLTRNEAPVCLRECVLTLSLWEVPSDVQVRLPSVLVAAALPRFERNHPGLADLPAFLRDPIASPTPSSSDVGSWRTRLDAAGVDAADLFTFSCAADVAEALDPVADVDVPTAAVVQATLAAIAARSAGAWIEHDPEAARNEAALADWITRSKSVPLPPFNLPLRPMSRDPAARMERRRAWDEVLAWLRAHVVDRHADVVDRRGLARHIRSLPRV